MDYRLHRGPCHQYTPMRNIDRQIIGLALPSIVSNITVPLLGLCDVTVMGHVGGAASIGAIAVGSMIFNVMYWLFVFLRMSTSGLTAQAYGARRWDLTRSTLRRSLTIGLTAGAAIVALQIPLQWLTFWLMQPTPDVAALCTPYYYICVWGAPAMLGLYVISGWLVGMQDTRRPMLIAIVQNVINIALSLLLVVAFGKGIIGVAIGTLVAQWAGFLIGLAVVLKSHRTNISQKPQSPQSPHNPTASTGTLNFVLFLRTLCLVSVNLYFTSAGAAQGPLILAANTLLMQFFMFFSYIMDGFANAGEAMSGRYLGAADSTMLRLTVRRLFLWGAVVAVIFTAAYALAGPLLLSLLTSDADVVATATTYLPWAIAIPACGTAAFVWDGIFIGTTRSKGMLAACFWAAIAFFTLWFGLNTTLSNHALWIALLVYLALRGLVQTWLWHHRFFYHRLH